MRLRVISALVAVLCFVSAPMLGAQTVNVTFGSINGRVVDSTNAVLPGVAVTATNLETAFKRSTVSEKDGGYVINLLPPGKYKVDAELSGLGKASLSGLTVLL